MYKWKDDALQAGYYRRQSVLSLAAKEDPKTIAALISSIEEFQNKPNVEENPDVHFESIPQLFG